MILYHQSLIHWLDNKTLRVLHLNCCQLRSGRIKSSAAAYVYQHDPVDLILYHEFVMAEMQRRGFVINKKWFNPDCCGKIYCRICDMEKYQSLYKDMRVKLFPPTIFPEHTTRFLDDCIADLEARKADVSLIRYAVANGIIP